MTRLLSEAGPSARDADPVAAARERIQAHALADCPAEAPRAVGLEIEYHLVDLSRPAARPSWETVTELVAGLPPMPSGSRVTTEPGGQLELSTPPAVGPAAAVAALRADEVVLRQALRRTGFGVAALGADPARTPRRINPSPRYAAMQRHFDAVDCFAAGTAMMTATAALQVNLDAGPAAGWADRVRLLRGLGPVLIAVSACSPYLGGRTSGWASMRQQAWHGIDHGRSDPVTGDDDPRGAWARYALQAPVMLVRDGDGGAQAVTERVPFAAWLRGEAPIDRAPTDADLDYHLTTLFPPIRPRGYLELRCLDAAPTRWWPALAALVATLADVPAAADAATEACEPVREQWQTAARCGLQDDALARAARSCTATAAAHGESGVGAELAELAELVAAGRSPGDELRARAETDGPLAVLEQEARCD